MKLKNMLWLAAVLMIPANVWAYGDSAGSGSGSGICKKGIFQHSSAIMQRWRQIAFSVMRQNQPFRKQLR